MAYGLVEDTTLTSLGNAIREKGIAPETRPKTIYVYGQLINTPISPEEDVDVIPEFPTFTTVITPAPATKFVIRIKTLKTHSDAGSYLGELTVRENGNPVGGNYIYNTDWWKDWTISTTGVDNVEVTLASTFAGELSCTVEVLAVDADGNYVEGGEMPYEIVVPNTLTPQAMAEAVNGANPLPPDSAFNISGDCQYKFAGNAWNWFLELYSGKLTTENVTSMFNMFLNSSALLNIPMDININNAKKFNNAFNGCYELLSVPKIRGTINWSTSTDFSTMLDGAYALRDIEDLFTPEMLEGHSTVKITSRYSCPKPIVLQCMYSLRRVPTWYYSQRLCPESTYYPATPFCPYHYAFRDCYALDELTNLPVHNSNCAMPDNMFTYAFRNCYRAKNITFETNADGTPIVTQWKSQTIDLTTGIGHTNGKASAVYSWNSGITVDKEVTDDATYAALKEDPDWFTNNFRYGRFNHDSAVALINSLPDTSAYLATAGGTNTLKLPSALTGSLTDGGAINTLTEEEIAVATAKGWTVTF